MIARALFLAALAALGCAPIARCQHLTSAERWSGATAKASLAVSGASAALTLPTADRNRTALAITAVSSAAITAGAIYLQDSYRDAYSQECKAK